MDVLLSLPIKQERNRFFNNNDFEETPTQPPPPPPLTTTTPLPEGEENNDSVVHSVQQQPPSPRTAFHSDNVSTASVIVSSSFERYVSYKIPENISSNGESVELLPAEAINASNIKENWNGLSKEELIIKLNDATNRWLYAFSNIDNIIKPSSTKEYISGVSLIVQLCERNFQLNDRFDLSSINKGWKTCIYEVAYLFYEFKKEDILYDIEPRSGITFLLQLNKLLEIINYCGKSLLNLHHAGVAFDPNYDYSMNDDTSLSRFSPMDHSKNSEYQNLLLYLLSTLYQKGFRRYRESVYRKIFTTNGCFTYSWVETGTIEDFVYGSIQKEINYDQWFNSTKNHANIKQATRHLTLCRDKEFPELHKNRNVFSFRNGVYIAKFPLDSDKNSKPVYDGFYRYGTQPSLPSSVVACKYFDMDFETFNLFDGEYGTSDVLDKINDDSWYEDIATPNFQRILEYQFSSFSDYHEISKWMYVLIGRLLYNVGECDSWQVFPYFQGIAGTGKGTILKIPAMFYEPPDIASLENTTEKIFGLEPLYDKYVFIAAELKDDLNIDQAKFQKMISGEDVSVAIKNKAAKSVLWKTPGAGAGNTILYPDNSGSMSRRFITFMFNKKIRKGEGDPMLEKKLQGEVARLLLKCNRAYCSAVNKYSNKDIWNVLPKYFLDIKDSISQESNIIKNFLSSGKIVFGENKVCTEKDFKIAFKIHCSENNLGTYKIGPSIYDEPFGEFSEKYNIEIKHVKNFNKVINGKRYTGNVIVGISLEDYGRENENGGEGCGNGEDNGAGVGGNNNNGIGPEPRFEIDTNTEVEL
jgi:hypothetical protein